MKKCKRNKFARCYDCYAYESLHSPGLSCLVGEKQKIIRNKYGQEIAYATRFNCRIKNIKDLIKRQEFFLERLSQPKENKI